MTTNTMQKAPGACDPKGPHTDTNGANFPTNSQPGKGQLQYDDLILTTTTAEVRVDSRTLARHLHNKHQSLFELLKNRRSDFEQLGILRFQTGVIDGRGQPEKFALLNEDQALLALAFSRNTERVRHLKVCLVKAFGEARRAMAMRQTEYLPSYHALHDQIKVVAAGSSHERHMHINFNRLLNKVAGVEPGERIAATVPKQAMLIVGQLLATAAMQTAKSGNAAYQQAKNALQPLSNAMQALEMSA